MNVQLIPEPFVEIPVELAEEKEFVEPTRSKSSARVEPTSQKRS